MQINYVALRIRSFCKSARCPSFWRSVTNNLYSSYRCMIQFTMKTGLHARCSVSTSIQSPRTECFTQNESRFARDQLSTLRTISPPRFVTLPSEFYIRQQRFHLRIDPVSRIFNSGIATCSSPIEQRDRMQAGIGAMC